ncbi:hypothetical protein FACS1894179_10670 [Bacteroidia bacterium]|nr:hypothetical protein FACS1894179_10670 [Bacteroidia bacterium]
MIVLLLINALKRSLSIELMSFFEYFPQKAICTKQAFSTIDDILGIARDHIIKEDIKILVIDPFNRLEHQ